MLKINSIKHNLNGDLKTCRLNLAENVLGV